MDEPDWPLNYFNYFTEIEEHFQQVRGTGLFLLSPLDWAVIESWKNAGIPIEAVLKGIDSTFEKWRKRKIKRRLINSVIYCSQAVLEMAQRIPARPGASLAAAEPPFSVDHLRAHLQKTIVVLRSKPEQVFQEVAASLDTIAAAAEQHIQDLEDLERRLTVLEEKLVAAIRMMENEETLYSLRHALDTELTSYRGKMTADQLAALERRYLDTALLERAGVPRLSLFYLR